MQARKHSKSRETIARELASLAALPVRALKKRWRSYYQCEPPHRVSRELLTRAVAYKIQEQAFGGLKPATRKLLLRLGDDAREGRPLRLAAAPPASPGTVLMRDWQGTTHEVKVLNGGVLYKGKRYRSLSEVARLITGARWNGPLFFGLRRKAQEVRNRGSR
jgi:DUF2924 family protein